MRIARVFPTRTSMTPTDPDAYYDAPDMFTPLYDEVHVSCTFTWDKQKAERLAYAWENKARTVKVGGPAYDMSGDFSGLYTIPGFTITSRGCPNKCSFCFVPKREGEIKELPIVAGNIINDNNLTACSREHIDKVFDMLKTQRQISFRGGLETRRIDDYFVEKLASVKVSDIWLAYDHPNAEEPLINAVGKLNKYFNRNKIRCYVLIGYRNDTMEQAEHRLRRAFEIGTLPFAMLYRDENNTPHSKEWRRFQRLWCRPAAIKSMVKSNLSAKE